MSMLLEALKKAALENKERVGQQAVLKSVVESRPPETVEPTNEAVDLVPPEQKNRPQSETLELVTESPALSSTDKQDDDWSEDIDFSELDARVERLNDGDYPVPNEAKNLGQFDGESPSFESTSKPEPGSNSSLREEHTSTGTEDNTNTHSKNEEILGPQEESEEDVIASIIADALAQTEEHTPDKSNEAAKKSEETKIALAELIKQSKSREAINNRRSILIFSILVVVSISLGSLYYYLLNLGSSNTLIPQNSGILTNSLPKQESITPTQEHDQPQQDPTSPSVRNATMNAGLKKQDKLENITETKKLVQKSIKPKKAVPKNKRLTTAIPKKIKSVKNKKIISVSPLSRHVYSAYEDYQKGSYKQALLGYLDAYAIDPNNLDVLLGLASSSGQLGKLDDSLQYYKHALRLSPKNVSALSGLLSITSKRTDYPELESHLKNLINDNPNDAHLHFLLGNLFISLNNWSGANIQLNTAVSLDPNNADYLYNLAISYDQLGKRHDALSYYKQAFARAQVGSASLSLQNLNARIKALSNTPSNNNMGSHDG